MTSKEYTMTPNSFLLACGVLLFVHGQNKEFSHGNTPKAKSMVRVLDSCESSLVNFFSQNHLGHQNRFKIHIRGCK